VIEPPVIGTIRHAISIDDVPGIMLGQAHALVASIMATMRQPQFETLLGRLRRADLP
jgi:hypothetical protein